jgi:Protein of unknown function (DUF3072)
MSGLDWEKARQREAGRSSGGQKWGASKVDPATAKQLDYLASLCRQLGQPIPKVRTRRDVSEAIGARKFELRQAEAQRKVAVAPMPSRRDRQRERRCGDGPSGEQQSYLKSLARQLGRETPAPTTKRGASKLIAQMRAELPG